MIRKRRKSFVCYAAITTAPSPTPFHGNRKVSFGDSEIIDILTESYAALGNAVVDCHDICFDFHNFIGKKTIIFTKINYSRTPL